MDKEDLRIVFLNNLTGFGPITILNLLEKTNSLAELWRLNYQSLQKIGLTKRKIKVLLKNRDSFQPEQLSRSLKKSSINILTILKDEYPTKLKEIYDSPPVLFYRGEINFQLPAVAIIGARNSTIYGRKVAFRTASLLAQRGINIISGLAAGIDVTAHKGALSIDSGITTAILGNGFDYIYPSQNKLIFNKIAHSGLLLTEFNPAVAPKPANFPRRNRLISGLADLVLVVEAGAKSGTLITVDYALDQGKDIMAVPANIDRPTAVGSNRLIKKGAAIFTGIEDIIDYLTDYLKSRTIVDDNYLTSKEELNKVYPDLDKDEIKILKLFQHEVELYYDDILRYSGLSSGKVDKILLKLQLLKIIIRLKGKKYHFKGLQNLIKPI